MGGCLTDFSGPNLHRRSDGCQSRVHSSRNLIRDLQLGDTWRGAWVLVDFNVLVVGRCVQWHPLLRTVGQELLEVLQLCSRRLVFEWITVETVHIRSDDLWTARRVRPQIDEQVRQDLEVGSCLLWRVVSILLVAKLLRTDRYAAM